MVRHKTQKQTTNMIKKDYTYCTGEGCPLKINCMRYNKEAKDSEEVLSWTDGHYDSRFDSCIIQDKKVNSDYITLSSNMFKQLKEKTGVEGDVLEICGYPVFDNPYIADNTMTAVGHIASKFKDATLKALLEK